MKSVLSGIFINSFALWATSQIMTGLVINGGFDVILIGGAVLTLMNLLVRPVLSLLTLPFNLLTMGLFSWVLNVFIIYLLTVAVSQISISAYAYPGFHANGFTIPKMTFSTLETTIFVAFLLSFTANFFSWLFRK